MNIAIPETPKNWAVPSLENGLIDIRKDERAKTIKEVIEFLIATYHCNSSIANTVKKHFLTPDPVEELAKELYGANTKGKGWGWEETSSKEAYLEEAAYILDNYELKKKP